MRLQITAINQEKCISCGKCVKACPILLFSEIDDEAENKKHFRFSDPHKLCVRCGHCIAICPPEAIEYQNADDPLNFDGTKKLSERLPYDELQIALRMRRSIRNYKQKKVPKEKIEQVLEAIRYAPSASNRQNWRFVVITKEEEIQYLSKQTAKFFKTAKRLLPLKYLIMPFLSKGARRRVRSPEAKIQVERGLQEINDGVDMVFFDAPCVILLYSRGYTNGLAENDAGIALTYGMLAAQSLGLGTCWIGFAQRRLQNFKKLRKHYNIPQGFNVRGVLALGEPALQYQRCPPRRTLRVQWIE